jgi:dihydroxyacetone kinase-like protein
MRLKRKETADIKEILTAAYEGAVDGMENTKNMIPRLGRSKNFRESAIGHADPGAMLVTIIFKGLSEGINV